jgi:hypothetical protein
MTNRRIFVEEGGKAVRKESNQEEWDLGSLRVGPSALRLKETSGEFDTDTVPIRVPDGLISAHVVNKGQLDAVDGRVDTTNIRIDGLTDQIDTNTSGVVTLLDAIERIFNGEPIEEHFIVGAGGQTIFNATIIEWDQSNAKPDITVWVDGRKQKQGTAFNKTSGTQIVFTSLIPEERVVTIRNSVPYLAKNYFVNYVTGYAGHFVNVGDVYEMANDRLMSFRNGIHLGRSAVIGNPVERYLEQSAIAVEVGGSALPDDIYTFVHQDNPPSYKVFNTGLTGPTITIPAYVMGSKRLRVYRNGLLMNPSALGDLVEQYTEATTTTITLASPSVADDVWLIEYSSVVPTWRQDISGIVGPTLTFASPYVVGDDKLLLWKNGILLLNATTLGEPADQYQETGTTTVQLQLAAEAGDWFTAIYQ